MWRRILFIACGLVTTSGAAAEPPQVALPQRVVEAPAEPTMPAPRVIVANPRIVAPRCTFRRALLASVDAL